MDDGGVALSVTPAAGNEREVCVERRFDPDETRDLSQQKAATAARLREQSRALFEQRAERALPEPENVLDAIDREKLKALGYLGEE